MASRPVCSPPATLYTVAECRVHLSWCRVTYICLGFQVLTDALDEESWWEGKISSTDETGDGQLRVWSGHACPCRGSELISLVVWHMGRAEEWWSEKSDWLWFSPESWLVLGLWLLKCVCFYKERLAVQIIITQWLCKSECQCVFKGTILPVSTKREFMFNVIQG